ncbi:phytoene desaturase family protein [Actinomyces polynesiensis]|uniref:phytoene desaturase family protein n=1 Tax=Actinomyces polynesiensis TaxID=1325934 RepID=UPI00093E2098|nr:phytoene desaturase family protein [Actinomyces polynesiensis]
MRNTRHPHVTRRPASGAPPHALVIGGGLAGLATAGLLARDGYEVDLFDRGPDVGGRVGEIRVDGFRFDTGPTWYLMPEVFEHFFALMGSRVEDHLDLVALDPAYRLFAGRRDPVDVRSGVERVVELFEGREPGAGAAVRAHLASAGETYSLAMDNFLHTNFQSVLPWLNRDVLVGLPRLVRLLTESLETQASRVVQDPVLRQMLTFHAVFLSTAPSMAPSMYHLMTHLDLEQGVFHPRGGMRRVVDAVRDVVLAAGVRIHTRCEVEEILTRPGGRGRTRATVTGLRVRDRDRDGHGDGRAVDVAGDVVVSTADLWHTETALLPAHLRSHSPRYWEHSTDGIGTVLAMLGVEGELPELAHHSFFFTDDWQENFAAIFGGGPRVPDPASVYACRAGATDPDTAPPGCETLFLLVLVAADEGIGHGSITRGHGTGDVPGDVEVEEAVDRAVEQVATWAGIPDLAGRIRTRVTLGPADHALLHHSRHGNALGPAHTLSQSAFLRAGSASRRVDGLLHAGQTTTPGIGVPMALISAENVLKRLHGDTSAGPLPEPPAPARPRTAAGPLPMDSVAALESAHAPGRSGSEPVGDPFPGGALPGGPFIGGTS